MFLPIQHVFHHPEILRTIERILGAPLIINNASLFAAEPGTVYQLGWHRDVIQIPQNEIIEAAIYNPKRFRGVRCTWVTTARPNLRPGISICWMRPSSPRNTEFLR